MFQSIELIITLLLSSVIAVAVLKYFNISSTLAYLFVGLLLGPHAFRVLPDSESIRPFLEFGIVFLMFTIGLEFSLPRLNSMRKIIFGLGGIQVIATILVVLIFSKLINLELCYDFTLFPSASKIKMSSKSNPIELPISTLLGIFALNWCSSFFIYTIFSLPRFSINSISGLKVNFVF